MEVQEDEYIVIQLSAYNIEKVLQKFLPYFFALVFITTVVGALTGYIEHDSWKIGDWLINYQGGMVRRGLIGEIIYQLSNFTHINPGIYVIVFQIFFYAIFLFFSYALLKEQHVLFPYALLIFSPFIFTFQINDLQGGFRKEIIYLALLSFVAWSAKTRDYKTFEKIFYGTLLLYPAVILTHEMLAIFLPYLLVVYLSVTTLNKKKFFLISLLLVPSIVSLIGSIHYAGTAFQVTEIFHSIARENYSLTGGAISWLDKGSFFGLYQVLKRIINNHYLYYYPQIIGLSLFAYIPVYKKLKMIIKNRLSLSLIFISIIGSIALFLVAIDWGRLIYIHLVSIFFLSLLPITSTSQKISPNKDHFQQPINLLKIFTIVFFIIYTLSWHIPHCCHPNPFATNYQQINIFAFKKPFVKIATHYFPEVKKKFK